MQCNQRLENQNQWSILKPVLKTVYELTKSDRSKYSAITTIRGTYGTAGFQTRLQRPVTGPVTQISKEFLEIEFK